MSIEDLIRNYQPNAEVLKKMAGIEVLATVGPSASGKTTIMNQLVKADSGFAMVIDETTRTPRGGEVPGRDFIFISSEQALEDIKTGNLVQTALGPNGDIYCTRPSDYPSGKIGLIALVPAAVQEFRKLPIKSFTASFVVPASFEKWLTWFDTQARTSGWDKAKRAGRLAEAKSSYKFALDDPAIKFVLNDEVEKAIKRLAQTSKGGPEDEDKARQIAQENLTKLNEYQRTAA